MEYKLIADQLRLLKLKGMAEAFEGMVNTPVQMRPSLEMAVSKMVEQEKRSRDDSKAARLLKASKLRFTVHIEDIICSKARNLTHEDLGAVSDCSFIRRGQNLLITGKTGCGKTWLACAIGHQACVLGLRTLFLSMNHFIDELQKCILDGTKDKLMKKLDRQDLVILDDFGLQKMNADVRLALLTMLEDRYDSRSLIITSQLPLEAWYEYLAEPTLADAIMDRIVNSSHHIRLEGESLRRNKTK